MIRKIITVIEIVAFISSIVPHILSNFKTFLNTFIVFGLALSGVLVVGKQQVQLQW
jgi:hypothetical protein